MTNQEQLIQLTKERMQFKDKRQTCEFCQFMRQKSTTDGGWKDMCCYSNIIEFEVVSQNSSCKFFAAKQ
jgi:hypothetical protein